MRRADHRGSWAGHGRLKNLTCCSSSLPFAPPRRTARALEKVLSVEPAPVPRADPGSGERALPVCPAPGLPSARARRLYTGRLEPAALWFSASAWPALERSGANLWVRALHRHPRGARQRGLGVREPRDIVPAPSGGFPVGALGTRPASVACALPPPRRPARANFLTPSGTPQSRGRHLSPRGWGCGLGAVALL